MAHPDDPLKALEEALRLSPDNLPLRRHFAALLMSQGRPEEAERQYRAALARWPADAELKLGLASAFHQQGKGQEAAVVLEELVTSDEAPARAHLLLARILFAAGEVEDAVRQYKKALGKDATLADPDLAGRLGVQDRARGVDEEDSAGSCESEVVDGRVRASWEGGGSSTVGPEVERPKTAFKDVGGMEALKDEIRMKIIHPLTHADHYRAYGKAIGGGILLYGPPAAARPT